MIALDFHIPQDYDFRTVKNLAKVAVALGALSACVGVFPARAQMQSAGASSSSSAESRLVNVRGQIYLPNGGLLQQSIRCELLSDDGSRPPEYFFTDSGGRFVLTRMRQLSTYFVVVEANGSSWGPTRAAIFVNGGRNTVVQVYLGPPERASRSTENTVSASSLQQRVPKDARKQFEGALKWIEKGDREKAHPMLARAVELYPSYVDAHNELAVELMKNDKLDEAEQHLRKALQVDPDAVRPLLNLGLCLTRGNRFADAQPFLEKAVQLRPDDTTGVLLLGINYVDLQNDKDAEPQLQRAYELGGAGAARAQYLLAQLYVRRKDYEHAATALETYLRDVPGAVDAPRLRQIADRLRLRAAAPRP